jgi:hypothetical protein
LGRDYGRVVRRLCDYCDDDDDDDDDDDVTYVRYHKD